MWKAYKNVQKENRNGKDKAASTNNILRNEVATVQRLSSDVSGKAQKYTRIGPREFVPYEYTDLTMANLKKAIITHLGSKKSFCDILAGEQGPSCKVLEQIPDLKMIYFRLIDHPQHLGGHGDYSRGSTSRMMVDKERKRPGSAVKLPTNIKRKRFSYNSDKDFAKVW